MSINPNHFECQHCSKTFVRETAYYNHKCKIMEKQEGLKTLTGQCAFSCFKTWFMLKKRILPGDGSKAFIESKYYASFIKFAEFIKNLNLTDTDLYIQIVVEKDLPPVMWTNDLAYRYYLEYIDKKLSPLQQVDLSVNTLMKMADKMECDVPTALQKVGIIGLISLIRERKLSPWLLLKSSKFMQLLRNSSRDEQNQITDLIRPEYWQYNLTNSKYQSQLTQITKIVQELNI